MNDQMNYQVSSNPHIRDKITTQGIMLLVIISLIPATVFGIFNFGLNAAILVIVTVASAVLAEYIMCKVLKKDVTIGDCSAALTGLLLALNLPPAAPWWIGVLGAFFAIVVVKMLFGGLGQNFMNPALGGRCFLILSFTTIMTNFAVPDVYTGATPLAAVKANGAYNVLDMVIGRTSGTIGETSMIAIVIGACFLILFDVITIRIPATYIITLVIFVTIFGGHGFDPTYISGHLAGGGLMLGAFYMATDYVTSPITRKGQYVYGVVLGLLTGIFRVFGPSAEGVSYAIIISNLLVPLIENMTLPKAFGKGGENA